MLPAACAALPTAIPSSTHAKRVDAFTLSLLHSFTHSLFRRRQYFAISVRLHARHHAGPLHLLDEPRGAVVADAQMPLHQRDGRAAGLEHYLHSLIVERIGFGIAFLQPAELATLLLAALQQTFDVLRLTAGFQVLDHF